jgi:signal-transduction protein with cAMP-binding, CBS, and nucleotidyltransferase domain
MNVFLDLRCVVGDDSLVRQLREYVWEAAAAKPDYLMHYARNCLLYKPPLTLFGHLKGNKQDGKTTLNIKSCIKPMEMFARLYALKNRLATVSTLARLRQLGEAGVLPDETHREMAYAFDYLWRLRFFNQLFTDGGPLSDELDLGALTDTERQNLKNVIAAIPGFQNRLSYDFLGTGS